MLRGVLLKPYFSNSTRFVSQQMQAKMEHFQRQDGVPVYRKMGTRDRALYGLTVALIVVGLIDGAHTLYLKAKRKK